MRLWRVRCDCGNEKVVIAGVLTNHKSRSCGCLRASLHHVHGHATRTGRTKTYQVWYNMIQRCYNEKNTQFADYGGRGIFVCARWRNFNYFLEDMGETAGKLTLERTNNDDGYTPENCRWVTRGENLRNKRNNVYVEFDGKRQCLQDWARDTGLNHRTLYQRYAVGDRGAALFRVPKKGERANT
jgi:hypothetical protein